ncbi:hypothetical protein JCM10213_000429 [Rhodosporidiobolus nylandii]
MVVSPSTRRSAPYPSPPSTDAAAAPPSSPCPSQQVAGELSRDVEPYPGEDLGDANAGDIFRRCTYLADEHDVGWVATVDYSARPALLAWRDLDTTRLAGLEVTGEVYLPLIVKADDLRSVRRLSFRTACVELGTVSATDVAKAFPNLTHLTVVNSYTAANPDVADLPSLFADCAHLVHLTITHRGLACWTPDSLPIEFDGDKHEDLLCGAKSLTLSPVRNWLPVDPLVDVEGLAMPVSEFIKHVLFDDTSGGHPAGQPQALPNLTRLRLIAGRRDRTADGRVERSVWSTPTSRPEGDTSGV